VLGLGGEAAVALSHRVNLRGGFNAFSYSRGFDKDGIHYASDLSFRSAEAHVDWFPFAGRLHLSPGVMLYNGNKVTASVSVPGGQTFTLGGTQYMSQSGNPITGSGKLEFNKAAPTVMVGLGNLVPRRRGKHFSANFEVGAAFAGSPQVTLGLSGGACDPTGLNCVNAGTDPTVQASVASEQKKINNDLSAFKVYPLIALSFGYRF
jgi:hypothetical protein